MTSLVPDVDEIIVLVGRIKDATDLLLETCSNTCGVADDLQDVHTEGAFNQLFGKLERVREQVVEMEVGVVVDKDLQPVKELGDKAVLAAGGRSLPE
tara:strand:- start:290 stop:580 length:291 start_codon:yes stop_codon:yes gene_type:complete